MIAMRAVEAPSSGMGVLRLQTDLEKAPSLNRFWCSEVKNTFVSLQTRYGTFSLSKDQSIKYLKFSSTKLCGKEV